MDAGFDAADRKALDAVLAGGDNADSPGWADPAKRTAAIDAAADAYTHGFVVAMIVTSAVLLAAAVAGWWLLRRRGVTTG